MSDIKIIIWANNLGITEPVNGSWIEAISDFYGSHPNQPHIQSIAEGLGLTEPVNGSWIQAISVFYGGTTDGEPYISQIATLTSGGTSSEFFEMTIDTTQTGSASDTFILLCGNIGTYNAVIDWGDGSTSDITTYNDADLTHVYSSSGTYQIKISGELPQIRFLGGGDCLKVISIDNWGTIPWYSFQYAFSGCRNMDILATDYPDLTTNSVQRIDQMFRNNNSLTVADFREWDTSNVTSMGIMFAGCNSATEINLTGWDTSNNTNCSQMFNSAANDVVIGMDTHNIEKVTVFSHFMFSCSFSTTEYDKVLVSWAAQDAVNGLNVNFGGSQYTLGSAAATARQSLLDDDLWTITDGGGI